MSALRGAVVEIVKDRGLLPLDAPVRLASGALSAHYVDGKRALARGADLVTACQAFLELARDEGVAFDAVGGLTMGADQFAHGISVLTGCDWFVVRKAVKDHGTKKRIEGTELRAGVDVLLVEDVVTSGGSILEALRAVEATGATVVLAVSLVDRGELAGRAFENERVPYRSLVSYCDLGIPPVELGQSDAQAAS